MTTTRHTAIYLLALSILCLPCCALAQKAGSSFMVSLTGGASFPVGKFASKDITGLHTITDEAGAAETGWNANLQLDYYIDQHFGVALQAGISQHQQNGEVFKKFLEAIYGNTAEVDSKSWNIIKVLAGPTYRAPIGKKINFRAGLSAGIAKTAIPGFGFAIYNSGGNPLLVATYSKIKMPAAFAYQVSSGLAYQLSKPICLLLELTYFNATAKFEDLIGPPNPIGPGPGSTGTESKHQLNALSASLGVGFRF